MGIMVQWLVTVKTCIFTCILWLVVLVIIISDIISNLSVLVTPMYGDYLHAPISRANRGVFKLTQEWKWARPKLFDCQGIMQWHWKDSDAGQCEWKKCSGQEVDADIRLNAHRFGLIVLLKCILASVHEGWIFVINEYRRINLFWGSMHIVMSCIIR